MLMALTGSFFLGIIHFLNETKCLWEIYGYKTYEQESEYDTDTN